MLIPIPVDQAWSFFSNPVNLQKITPPHMKFNILSTDLPDTIYSGMMIQYAVSPIPGYSIKWLTEIKHVNKPNYFIDEQRSGPYSLWYHQHIFMSQGSQTLMKDEVHYALPLFFLGTLAHTFYVRNKLEKIFDYRKKIISQMFNK